MNEITGAIPAHLMERPEPPAKQDGGMGKDDFMNLLMAQLKHQDPLNPMDHKEFSAQLAQFASLEKLTQIGTGIQKLEGGMGEEAKLQALGMIGKRVKAGGAEIQLLENQPVDIRLNTDGGFKPLKVSIYGGDGKLVREIEMDGKSDGKSITWDGKTQDNANAPSGKYLFRVAGVGADGKSKEMEASINGKVIGVEMSDKTPMLLVATASGQTKVEISKIDNISIDEPVQAAKPGTQSVPMPAAGTTAKAPVAAAPAASGEKQAEPNEWPRSALSEMGGRAWGGMP